jgi:LacI family transcriptional regulator
MQELGFPPSVLTHSTEDALVSAIEASRATALFCHNDWLGLAALRAVERMGKRVPEDVSVLGVDDSPTFTELFPGLTTLRYPLEQVAEVAAAYVVLGEEPGEIAPLQVVERSSVRRIG